MGTWMIDTPSPRSPDTAPESTSGRNLLFEGSEHHSMIRPDGGTIGSNMVLRSLVVVCRNEQQRG